jgi:hypothetical protein
MTRRHVLLSLVLICVPGVFGQQKSSGPKPPKSDLPYLLEAEKLIPTDAQPLTRSGAKDDETITVNGATSSARTPLPEPIFLFAPGQINASDFELIQFQVVNGKRQWKKGQPANSGDEPAPVLRLTLRPVSEGVVRIEAAAMLNPGEFALLPRGKNTAFCFTVF